VNPTKLDHVAYWLANRDEVAELCVARLGMHVIDRTDAFTLIGSNARRGKLTLFAAEGPRERGALKHVALRVSSLEEAGLDETSFQVGDVVLEVVEAPTDVDFDLDHVALYARDPEQTAQEYLKLGFAPAGPRRVEVGGAYVEFHEGDPGEPERPLLNHLAVLVESTDEHIQTAKDLGIEIDSVVDAANTYAVFVWGPERVRVEYVEHKSTFSLV
jgi:catechol 2,3-dioxygenase-like lactoylglutathione lyase family enzyme